MVTTGIWALRSGGDVAALRRGRSGVAVFLATMTVNEIPLVLLALLLFGVIDGWRDQVISGPAGLIAAFLGAERIPVVGSRSFTPTADETGTSCGGHHGNSTGPPLSLMSGTKGRRSSRVRARGSSDCTRTRSP